MSVEVNTYNIYMDGGPAQFLMLREGKNRLVLALAGINLRAMQGEEFSLEVTVSNAGTNGISALDIDLCEFSEDITTHVTRGAGNKFVFSGTIKSGLTVEENGIIVKAIDSNNQELDMADYYVTFSGNNSRISLVKLLCDDVEEEYYVYNSSALKYSQINGRLSAYAEGEKYPGNIDVGTYQQNIMIGWNYSPIIYGRLIYKENGLDDTYTREGLYLALKYVNPGYRSVLIETGDDEKVDLTTTGSGILYLGKTVDQHGSIPMKMTIVGGSTFLGLLESNFSVYYENKVLANVSNANRADMYMYGQYGQVPSGNGDMLIHFSQGFSEIVSALGQNGIMAHVVYSDGTATQHSQFTLVSGDSDMKVELGKIDNIERIIIECWNNELAPIINENAIMQSLRFVSDSQQVGLFAIETHISN